MKRAKEMIRAKIINNLEALLMAEIAKIKQTLKARIILDIKMASVKTII